MYNRRNERNSGDRRRWRGYIGNGHSLLSRLWALLDLFSGFYNTKPHLGILDTKTFRDLKSNQINILLAVRQKWNLPAWPGPASHGSLWDPCWTQHSLAGLWLESGCLFLLQDVVQVSDRTCSASVIKPGAFPSSER